MGHTPNISKVRPANLLGQEAQADNTYSNKITSPLTAEVFLLFMAFLLFSPSSVDNLLMAQWRGGSF